MTVLYRIETWLPAERAWQVQGFVSEADAAADSRDMFEERGEKAAVVAVDLDNPIDRDAICAYLTQFFGHLAAQYPAATDDRNSTGS